MERIFLNKIEQKYGVKIISAEIKGGRRWKFREAVDLKLQVSESKRFQVNEKNGLIVYNWNSLNLSQQKELESEIVSLKEIPKENRNANK